MEEACNSARTRAKLKRRWPLKSLQVLVPPKSVAVAKRAKGTVALLCNVKNVSITSSSSKFPARFSMVANRSRVGALFKERTRDVLSGLGTLEGPEALRVYSRGRPVSAGSFEVPLSAFELVTSADEGWEVADKSGVFVALQKERDSDLVAEGLVRDVARRLQALRKERGYVPTAMLRVANIAGLEEEDSKLLESRKKKIAFLVRVRQVEITADHEGRGWTEADLDGKPIYLDVR